MLSRDTDADADYESEDDTTSESSEGTSQEPSNMAKPVHWKVNKKYSGKKKLRNTDEWARNRVKRARNEGKSYVDRKGNVHGHKTVKEYNHTCRYDCNNNINENKRNTIFQDF
ncbi:unnamed protein product [Diabrotica balteata]|uniref:Uncharacterized protein n=1 Tax=Diabrotica balteata TaxID=107213 RepID=A0A9N9SM23_DIABA|nr:unnamed protein product [Diabrotica balteata]